MRVFRRAVNLLRQFFRPFLLVNLVYFGLVGCGMAYGAWDQDTHNAIIKNVRAEGPKSLPAVFHAYSDRQFFSAVGLTFAVNLVLGSIVFLTLPSLVVPFAGLLLGAVRAIVWGLVFAPVPFVLSGVSMAFALLVGLLVFLEGEGYVLAVLASYVQGKSFLFPASAQAASHWQGYKVGAMRTLQLYPLVAGVLAVAAIYEATLAIFLLPLLK